MSDVGTLRHRCALLGQRTAGLRNLYVEQPFTAEPSGGPRQAAGAR